MRVLLAAIECHKGHPTRNMHAHCEILGEARVLGCRMVVFPEMSLSGSVDPARRPEHLMTLDAPQVGGLAAATGDVAALFGIAEQAEDGPFITQVFADG